MLPLPGLASTCGVTEQPQHSVEFEQGASAASLSGNRGTWQEQQVIAVARDGNAGSAYVRAASDQRFGATDNVYELGTYVRVAPRVMINAIGSFSPQHNVVAASTEDFGADVRSSGGYGYQLGYGVRNYPSLVAEIGTAGADRYWGVNHLQYIVTFARLSNVPGLAFSQGVRYQRFLACDTVSFAVSGGRDVENTGINAIAVYKSFTLDADATHWYTQRFGVHVGAGLYLLSGAYNRFEVRFALRERL